MSVLLCCCCCGFEATEANGLCEYCAVLCVSGRLKGEACRVLERLRKAERRGFPCSFEVGVVCSFKKSAKSVVFGECYSCRHYLKFLADMDKEEEDFFDEADKARKGV